MDNINNKTGICSVKGYKAAAENDTLALANDDEEKREKLTAEMALS